VLALGATCVFWGVLTGVMHRHNTVSDPKATPPGRTSYASVVSSGGGAGARVAVSRAVGKARGEVGVDGAGPAEEPTTPLEDVFDEGANGSHVINGGTNYTRAQVGCSPCPPLNLFAIFA
jgi:hypothetical protein